MLGSLFHESDFIMQKLDNKSPDPDKSVTVEVVEESPFNYYYYYCAHYYNIWKEFTRNHNHHQLSLLQFSAIEVQRGENMNELMNGWGGVCKSSLCLKMIDENEAVFCSRFDDDLQEEQNK